MCPRRVDLNLIKVMKAIKAKPFLTLLHNVLFYKV